MQRLLWEVTLCTVTHVYVFCSRCVDLRRRGDPFVVTGWSATFATVALGHNRFLLLYLAAHRQQSAFPSEDRFKSRTHSCQAIETAFSPMVHKLSIKKELVQKRQDMSYQLNLGTCVPLLASKTQLVVAKMPNWWFRQNFRFRWPSPETESSCTSHATWR